MHHYLGSAWTAARLAALAATAALLAGCMIVSESELIPDSEGTHVLPAKAYLTGYDEDGPNTWKVSDDPPIEMTLTGNTYKSADGAITARFVPFESHPARYLLGIVSPDGSLYGAATFKDDILVIDLTLGDPNALATAQASGDPVLATLEAQEGQDGGIVVQTREQLDALMQLYLDEKLGLMSLVLYMTETPDAAKPARIVYADGIYRKE
jgi:hypothetical protein